MKEHQDTYSFGHLLHQLHVVQIAFGDHTWSGPAKVLQEKHQEPQFQRIFVGPNGKYQEKIVFKPLSVADLAINDEFTDKNHQM